MNTQKQNSEFIVKIDTALSKFTEKDIKGLVLNILQYGIVKGTSKHASEFNDLLIKSRKNGFTTNDVVRHIIINYWNNNFHCCGEE